MGILLVELSRHFAGRAQQALGLVAAHTQVWLVAGSSTAGAAKTGLGGLVARIRGLHQVENLGRGTVPGCWTCVSFFRDLERLLLRILYFRISPYHHLASKGRQTQNKFLKYLTGNRTTKGR